MSLHGLVSRELDKNAELFLINQCIFPQSKLNFFPPFCQLVVKVHGFMKAPFSVPYVAVSWRSVDSVCRPMRIKVKQRHLLISTSSEIV